MSEHPPQIVNIEDIKEVEQNGGPYWRSMDKRLTPAMRKMGGKLGVVLTRIPPGASGCPFHAHQLEDEVFYVLSGRGVLRYGDTVTEIRSGDCISCPAGTGIAHQLANPFESDLTYLAIGPHEPDEVCVYPDSGKVLVRSLGRLGYLNNADYLEGEPDEPLIFGMARKSGGNAAK